MGLLHQARPIIAAPVRQVRETSYSAVLRRDAVVPIEVVEADRPVRIVSPLGEGLPLHSTAAGKALLAFEPDDALRALLPDGLPRFTERTVTDRQALLQQLRSVATAGYAVDGGEHVEDVRAVAAPGRDYTRTLVGTLAGVGAPLPLPSRPVGEESAAPLG